MLSPNNKRNKLILYNYYFLIRLKDPPFPKVDEENYHVKEPVNLVPVFLGLSLVFLIRTKRNTPTVS